MPLWCVPSQVRPGVPIICLSHPLSSMRAGGGPRSRTESVGARQRSGIQDLVSDGAVAAGMTAICFYGGSNCGLGHGARLEVRDAALNLFDGAGDDIRTAIQVVAMHRPNVASLQLARPSTSSTTGGSCHIVLWRSSRNAGRDQIGMVGDIIADSRATSPGIRS